MKNVLRSQFPLVALAACVAFGTISPINAASPPSEGLVLWLDAADPDGDGTSENDPVSGSLLGCWRDKSSAGNHVRQEQSERQPTFVADAIGGKPVVRFGKNLLQIPEMTGFRPGAARFHAFIVMQAACQPTGSPRLLDLPSIGVKPQPGQDFTINRRGFWLGYQDFAEATGKLRIGIHAGDEGQVQGITWDGKPRLAEAVYAGNQRWSLFQGGALDGRGRFTGDNTFSGFEGGIRLALGQHYGSADEETFFHGEIAEILLYNRILQFQEQYQIGQYLTAKYSLSTSYAETSPPAPHFESDILPLLVRSCGDCHSESDAEGSLHLTSLAGLLRGGVSGPAVEPGFASDSLLLDRISTDEMPPADGGEPLPGREIDLIRHWIDSGAHADEEVDPAILASNTKNDHWAFQQLREPEIPRVENSTQVRTTVDTFLLQKLEENNLRFSPDADRITLIRRAYLDLLGLLPTPQEVDSFVADDRSDAWERLLERLLDSPHFGERWGRHWLDGVGYSDTLGLDNDQTIVELAPGKWKYRDYVVASLNEDKPFTQFLTEQLAGDELIDWRSADGLTPEMQNLLVATGLMRCSSDITAAPEANTLEERYKVLHHTCEILAGNLLGLTVQCCKCHDHKYEQLSQRDYYRFSAIFSPALNPNAWLQPTTRQLPGLSKAELADVNLQVEENRERQRQVREQAKARLIEEKYAKLPEEIREDVRASLNLPAEKRTEVQKYLAERFEDILESKEEEVLSVMTEEERTVDSECSTSIERLNDRKQAATIQAVYDTGAASTMYVHRRGNYETPGAIARPGLFGVIAVGGGGPSAVEDASGATSGRRLALARRLTDWSTPAGALVARVRVNRVWQRLFGRGLVETADNFGASGTEPTHADLLEWLAGDFVRSERRLKPLLKLLMNSTVYRQSAQSRAGFVQQASGLASPVSSGSGVDPRTVDPDNRLLWRQRLRRLESEIIRDTMLSASRRLDPTLGGPPVLTKNKPDGMVVETGFEEDPPQRRWRRSMYLVQRRNYHLSILAAFDQPLMVQNCTRRDASSVVSQSLMMLNDRAVLQHADDIAKRVSQEHLDGLVDKLVETAFRLILIRPPQEEERVWCVEAYDKHIQTSEQAGMDAQQARHQALVQICHMLLNTSEFLYIQ